MVETNDQGDGGQEQQEQPQDSDELVEQQLNGFWEIYFWRR